MRGGELDEEDVSSSPGSLVFRRVFLAARVDLLVHFAPSRRPSRRRSRRPSLVDGLVDLLVDVLVDGLVDHKVVRLTLVDLLVYSLLG